jgi:hypothetical protein
MQMFVTGRDKAKAETDTAPWADRIWVTVTGGDFKGTVALNMDTAESLMHDIESCIDDIRLRKEKVK